MNATEVRNATILTQTFPEGGTRRVRVIGTQFVSGETWILVREIGTRARTIRANEVLVHPSTLSEGGKS